MDRIIPFNSTDARLASEGLVKVVVVVLSALLVVQAARIAFVLARPALPTAPSKAAPTPRPPAPDLSVFARFDPFVRVQPIEEAEPAGEVIGVQLFGVRVAPGTRGSAILGSGGTQATFSVGEEVRPGVVLVQVSVDHVVLDRRGARTRIEFGPLAPPLDAPIAPAKAAPNSQGAMTAPASPAAGPAPLSEAPSP